MMNAVTPMTVTANFLKVVNGHGRFTVRLRSVSKSPKSAASHEGFFGRLVRIADHLDRSDTDDVPDLLVADELDKLAYALDA